MKKAMSLFLAAVLLLALYASAEPAGMPGEEAFKNAKESVSLISYGEYDMALRKLGLESVYDAGSIKKFIDKECPEIYMGSVQTEVSVAWPEEGVWKLAVPFEAPEDEAVGALVFVFSEGRFTEVAFMRWGDVCTAYEMAGQEVWNVAYTPSYVIVEDW